MKINVALWDRILRFIFGVIFTSWAVAGGPWWSYSGVYLILSSSWAWCAFYAYFKIRTFRFDDRPMVPPE
jgi:hypothetical protein